MQHCCFLRARLTRRTLVRQVRNLRQKMPHTKYDPQSPSCLHGASSKSTQTRLPRVSSSSSVLASAPNEPAQRPAKRIRATHEDDIVVELDSGDDDLQAALRASLAQPGIRQGPGDLLWRRRRLISARGARC